LPPNGKANKGTTQRLNCPARGTDACVVSVPPGLPSPCSCTSTRSPPAAPVHMPFSSVQADWQPWKIMSIARRNWVAEYRSRHHSAHFYAQLHRPKADPHFCSITPSDRACAPTLSNRVDRGNSRRHHSHHSHHRLPLPRRLRQHRRSRTRQIDARYDVLRPRTTSVSTAYR